jgi:thioredoxin reductase (NADPH)
MDRPVILAVDNRPSELELIRSALDKRYGADYEVLCESSPREGLKRLRALKTEGREVALVLADQWMPRLTGIEFLDRARDKHPLARRVLLVHLGDRSVTDSIAQAMTLGQIDHFTIKPIGRVDEGFHRTITAFLDEWAQDHRPNIEMLKLVGDRWTARCHELRDLLDRYRIPFGFYDVESDAGQALLAQAQCPDGPLPVALLFNGQVLTDPTNEALADALTGGERPSGDVYDLVIVGAGPAGLSAAVYGASEGLRTLVLEREAIGGQAGTSTRIRNYLGFPSGVSGGDLASRATEQAQLFGADFYTMREVTSLQCGGPAHHLSLSDGLEIRTRALALATGVSYRKLGIPGLDALTGRGVYYGAAASEAPAMQGQRVFVAGGANSAGQAAVHLARFAEKVTMLVRGDSLSALMSDYLLQEIEATDNIEVRLHTIAKDCWGERRLEGLVVENTQTGETERLPGAALFVLIGAAPHTGWLPPELLRDERGFVLTGNDLLDNGVICKEWPIERRPYQFETSIPGVFCIGDVRHGSVKRVAAAVGEGGGVVQEIHQYLAQ